MERRIRVGKFIPFVALFLVMIVLILCEFLIWRPARQAASLEVAPLTFAGDTPYTAVSNGILYWEKGRLYKIDPAGRAMWNSEAAVQGTLAASNQLTALYTERLMQVYDENGARLFEQSYGTDKLIMARCGQDTAAALVQTADGGYRLDVFDRAGAQVDQIALQDQTALKFDYAPDGKQVWVITLDTLAPSPLSRLTTYNPGKAVSGMVTAYNQVCYDALVTDENYLLIGTNNVVCYNKDGEKQYERLVYGWSVTDAAQLDKAMRLALIPQQLDSVTNLAPTQLQLATLPEGDKSLKLPDDTHSVYFGRSKVYAFAGRNVYTYSLSGQSEGNTLLPIDIQSVTLSPDRSFALVSDGASVYKVPLG